MTVIFRTVLNGKRKGGREWNHMIRRFFAKPYRLKKLETHSVSLPKRESRTESEARVWEWKKGCAQDIRGSGDREQTPRALEHWSTTTVTQQSYYNNRRRFLQCQWEAWKLIKGIRIGTKVGWIGTECIQIIPEIRALCPTGYAVESTSVCSRALQEPLISKLVQIVIFRLTRLTRRD